MSMAMSTEAGVVLHPLVLLSIQDHAARVVKGTKKRVIGILLGQDLGVGKGYNVANSFAVPFEEDEKDPRTWFLDHNYIESMNDMFKKVNAREKLIGWYHTGPKLRASDLEINEVMKRFTPKPVMVIVDIRPDNERADGGSGIPTDAYFAVEEIKDDGTATRRTFVHVPSSIEAEEAEEIGVEHLLRDIKSLSLSGGTGGSLASRVSSQLSSLQGLSSRLVEIREYLTAVILGPDSPGGLPVNHQILYHLQDIFNLLPNLEATESAGGGSGSSDIKGKKRPFTTATNDQLLVLYLSSLIRAVIALHDLVLNKQSASLLDDPLASTDDVEEEKKDGDKPKDTKSDAEKAKDWFAVGKDKEGDKDKDAKKEDGDKRGL